MIYDLSTEAGLFIGLPLYISKTRQIVTDDLKYNVPKDHHCRKHAKNMLNNNSTSFPIFVPVLPG